MITDLIISTIGGFISWLISFLPNFVGMPSGFNTAVDQISNALSGFNSVFPVDTMLTIMGIAISIEFGIFTFRTFNWIFNKIRGSG